MNHLASLQLLAQSNNVEIADIDILLTIRTTSVPEGSIAIAQFAGR
jgi:hypothetical protein